MARPMIRSLIVLMLALPATAQESPQGIPDAEINALHEALAEHKTQSSAIRKRLALKKVVTQAAAVAAKYPSSPDRFRALAVVFDANRALFAVQDSDAHREALYASAEQLAQAPDEWAQLRLPADLLLMQRHIAALDGDKPQQAHMIRRFVTRYQHTSAEAECLKVSALLAMKLSDLPLLEYVRKAMRSRYIGDYDMIAFQRDRLPLGHFSASFRGTFERVDGGTMCLPMDRIGESTIYFFWSKQNANLAETIEKWKGLQESRTPDYFDIYSINVDELADGGASVLKEMGVDWPTLRLPGGRENAAYKAFVRREPVDVHVSPSGMSDLTSYYEGGKFGSRAAYSYMQRDLTYLSQMRSLAIGEFLVVNPTGGIDPVAPPELSLVAGAPKLVRTAASVPAGTLAEIQACFVRPPRRYTLSQDEERANYTKADALCRETISKHPNAPDLWIVRNRQIVARLGLWKLSSEPNDMAFAAEAAQAAIQADAPPGASVVPRFCLAKLALRNADNEPVAVVASYLEAAGGDRATGGALAAAAVLAWDACVPRLHETYRRELIDNHFTDPMAWAALTAMRDRFHRYHLYATPYFYGRFGARRKQAALRAYHPDSARWSVDAEFVTLDGSAFRIPQDTAGKWAVIAFVPPGKASISDRDLKGLLSATAGRPAGGVRLYFAVIGDDASAITAAIGSAAPRATILTVPGGYDHRAVHQLGVAGPGTPPAIVIMRPDGTIAETQTGLIATNTGLPWGSLVMPVIDWHDRHDFDAVMAEGDLAEAKRIALAMAPLDRELKHISATGLQMRAQVRVAMEEWDAALADISSVISRRHMGPGRAAPLRIRAEIYDHLGQAELAQRDRQAAKTFERQATQ